MTQGTPIRDLKRIWSLSRWTGFIAAATNLRDALLIYIVAIHQV